MMSRRGGAKIHSSVQAQQPFSWVLGDGSVIGGLELAILGGDEGLDPSVDKPPKSLLPGGARRVIISQKTGLGYGTKNAIGRPIFLKLARCRLRDLGGVTRRATWSSHMCASKTFI